jgi:hypothetical protein
MVGVRQVLVLVLIAVLAACGGPSTAPDPDPDPVVSGVSPSVAPRGASVVVSGADFGSSGTMTIGGVEADVTSWSDTEIEAVVAVGTPNAWQDVEVVTGDGSASFWGFFVGVEYAGTAANLQAFLDDLVPGTAVLLQAQTYDLSAAAQPLVVDNRELHGRGESQTTIVGPTATGLMLLADFDQATTLADMTVEVDSMVFFHGSLVETLGAIGPTAHAVGADRSLERGAAESVSIAAVLERAEAAVATASGIVPAAALGNGPALTSLVEAFGGALSLGRFRLAGVPDSVAPLAVGPAQIRLSSVTLTEVAGGSYYGLPFMALPALDFSFDGVTIAAENTALFLVSTQGYAFQDSDVSAGEILLLSFFGSVSITDSILVSGTDVVLAAESGIAVDASTVRASDGDILVHGAYTSYGTGVPAGGPVIITGSTIEALDADFGDGNDTGAIEIITQYAPIRVQDNVRLRSHDGMALGTAASFIGEADVVIEGNQEIRVGVFQADDPVDFRAGGLMLVTLGGGQPDTIRLEGNDIAATAGMAAMAGTAAPGNLVARSNTVVAGDELDSGVIMIAAATLGAFVLEGNDFSVDATIMLQAADLDGGTAILSGNELKAVGDTAPIIYVIAAGGSCEVSGNVILTEDTGANDPSAFLFGCEGDGPSAAHVLHENSVTNLGNGGALSQLAFQFGTLTMDSNDIATESLVNFVGADVDATVTSNALGFATGLTGWVAVGNADSQLVIEGNAVTFEGVSGYGLALGGVGDATVTGNTFASSGTPGPGSIALGLFASSNAVALTASGNSFTNFANALYFADRSVGDGGAFGITAAINDNVFDFEIDAAPKVAELLHVADVIDATSNQWGTNTELATVESYVTLSGDTVGEGGGIDLDPIVVP